VKSVFTWGTALRRGSPPRLLSILLLAAALLYLGSSALMARALAQSAPATLKAIDPVASCASLSGADLKAATGAATTADAKEISSPKGRFCRVTGTIAPAIGYEVDLPMKGWTQRYLQTGCGGLCGNLDVQVSHAGTCLPAVNGEMVVASDDMGHRNVGGPGGDGDAAFGLDPQKRIDFAYRGNHVTALAAKALIKAFYGQAPRYSYFSGCSDGGREALVEAERFPDDFDGVAAGAPAMNFQVQNSFYHAWQARSNTGPDGKAILIASRLPVLHKAVLAACDALDGQVDGLISDPRACKFDPGSAQCAPGATDSANCLTAAEVDAARRLYAGPRDAEGHRFTIGQPQYGSELSWEGVFVPRSADQPIPSKGMAAGSSTYVIFPEAPAKDGDIDHFEFTQAHFARLADLHPLYDATDVDLERFQAKGGKLLLWHGWSDPHISPLNTIAYDESVRKFMGEAKANGFLRLFLFPGVYHCGGGDGFSQFDVLTPLMAWVEQGRAPDRIDAAQTPPGFGPFGAGPPPRGAPPINGVPPDGPAPPFIAGSKPAPLPMPDAPAVRTRPVFAYPMQAHYSGQGDPDDGRNYTAVEGPRSDLASLKWEGSHFMGPDILKTYTVADGRLTATP